MLTVKKKLYAGLHHLRYLQCKNSTRKSLNEHTNIYIFGESRGGSTFLTELFLDGHRSVLWEPLMPNVLQKYNSTFYNELGNIPYIHPDADWKDGKDYFHNLFNGSVLMPGMFNFNLADINYHSPNKSIIKFCRGNALLPWITNNFDVLPIFLIRHPLAVISSQLRFGSFQGYTVLPSVLDYQHGKFKALFYNHEDKITGITSVEEMFTVWWCLKNYDAVFSTQKKWLTVSYEYLLKYPVEERKRIEDYLKTPFSEEFDVKFKRPSSTTQKGSNILEGKNQLATWKSHLSQHQIKIILDTLHKFGFEMFTENIQPEFSLLGYR